MGRLAWIGLWGGFLLPAAALGQPYNPAPPAAPAAPQDWNAPNQARELLSRAETLAARGDLSKAMEFDNRALTLDPRNADAYRQRALTLARLGDSAQAQADYNRFLELSPQSRARVQEELDLFDRSGRSQSGQASDRPAASGFSPDFPSGPAERAAMLSSLARNELRGGRNDVALRLAREADELLPSGRTHALMARRCSPKVNSAPRRRVRTEQVTVMRRVPVRRKEQYTVMVPYEEEQQVPVQVCRMVPRQVAQTAAAPCGVCR